MSRLLLLLRRGLNYVGSDFAAFCFCSFAFGAVYDGEVEERGNGTVSARDCSVSRAV